MNGLTTENGVRVCLGSIIEMSSGEKGRCASDEALRLGWAIEPDRFDKRPVTNFQKV